jgi:MFS family permease
LKRRLIAGATGAVSFVVGGGLMSQAGRLSSNARATLMLGVYFAGAGGGVVLSGLIVPVALSWGGWRMAWLVLGGLSVLALAIAAPAARSLPETEPAASPGERGRLPLRPSAGFAGRLRVIRGRVHRLHDVHRRGVRGRGRDERPGDCLLGGAGGGSGRFRVRVEPAA